MPPSPEFKMAKGVIQSIRKTLEQLLQDEAEHIGGSKPEICQGTGHRYSVNLCLGKGENFYNIGKWYNICTVSSHRGKPCAEAVFLSSSSNLPSDQKARVEELWVRYCQTGAKYSDHYPPTHLLSTLYLSPKLVGNSHIPSLLPNKNKPINDVKTATYLQDGRKCMATHLDDDKAVIKRRKGGYPTSVVEKANMKHLGTFEIRTMDGSGK